MTFTFCCKTIDLKSGGSDILRINSSKTNCHAGGIVIMAKKSAPSANWKTGKRFGSADKAALKAWAEGQGL